MAIMANDPGRRFTNQEIAERLMASSHHLAKVMQRLAKAELVNSTRGPQGGFRLADSAESMRLITIFEAIEGPISEGGCLLGEPICEGSDCVLGEVIQSVHRQVRDYLAKTTLAELAQGVALVKKKKKASVRGR